MKNLMKLPLEIIIIHHNTLIKIIIIQDTHNNNNNNICSHLHLIICLNSLITIIDLVIIIRIIFLHHSQKDKYKIIILNKIHLA